MSTRDTTKWQSVILSPKQLGRYLVADLHDTEFDADYKQRDSGSRYWDVPNTVTIMKWKELKPTNTCST